MPSDFRSKRRKLPSYVFLGGRKRIPPSDLISKETWDQIMHLADDVVLMTSEHYGSIIKTLREAAHAVTEIGLFIMDADPESPLDYYTADARDELDASLFNAWIL